MILEIVKPEYSISERFVVTLTDHNSNKILLEAKQPSVDLDKIHTNNYDGFGFKILIKVF